MSTPPPDSSPESESTSFAESSPVPAAALPPLPGAEEVDASEVRAQNLLATIDVGYCIIEVLFDEQGRPVDYRFLETNPAFEAHTGLHDVVGVRMREMVPEHDRIWFENYGSVALTGTPLRFESEAVAMGRWFEVYAQRVGRPEEHQVAVLFTDITKRKVGEKQLRDTQAHLEAALLAGDIATWAWDVANDRVIADPNLARLFFIDVKAAAGGKLEVYLDAIHPEDRERVGETITRAVAEQDRYEAEYRVLLPDGSVRWLVARGKVERDAVTGRALSLPGVVVDITERRLLEEDRERLLEQARARAEREALLNRIGAVIRTVIAAESAPEGVLQATAMALGQGLRVDRCYFVRFESSGETARVIAEWYRTDAGLEPLVGRSSIRRSVYSEGQTAGYGTESTLVIADAAEVAPEYAVLLRAVGFRALVRVPIESSEGATALGVAMTESPRQWTPGEVRLVENVAALVWSALESAQAQQRERNIAVQLQDALIPLPPADLPGLALASLYRSALDEAGVGGDFFDVFPVDAGCTALVVGDLSGKGLAAASEVAIVRNMLRFALYRGGPLAEAVAELHETLIQRHLLAGFATLFVGIYDPMRRTLTYVNCGQEPGLVWRAATGAVELLETTAPVLGAFRASPEEHRSETLMLQDGDVLALFTDGLTDVGPSRTALLEIAGVRRLLSECCASSSAAARPYPDAAPSAMAQATLNCLIAGVDTFAQGGMQDDIALLLGVVHTATG